VFADNVTVTPNELSNTDTPLMFDYHLMVKDPIKWVDRCITGRADRIFGHIEMMPNQIEFVQRVSDEELKVGLAIDIDTPILSLEPDVLQEIDAVLIMSVKAGHGGQEFREEALEKIKELAEIRQKENAAFFICVDGGITPANIFDVYKAGADEVIVGKRLFEGDLRTIIAEYQNASERVQ
jgi:ribulose-phosphate 3-epimerase